jgi:hypothetical protein
MGGPLELARVPPRRVLLQARLPPQLPVASGSRGAASPARTIDAAEDLPEQRHGLLILTLARQSPSHRWAVTAGANQDFTHTYIGDEPAFTR